MISDDAHRTEILNRLKRAEGQLRGVQRMIVEGKSCLETLDQIEAARKALDGARARVVLCHLNQELRERLDLTRREDTRVAELLDEMQLLIAKSR
ncbi:MAG: metal-sensitive transcriptional regulator [Burkholderiales bacterium]|nr:metal-sensitive transcriptional regulator [Burkholderiales bacterium]